MEDNFVANPVRNIISNGVKLTSAVYNLLEYFPEADPLKNKAKEKALAVLENLSLIFTDEGWLSLKDYFSGNRERAKLQTLEDIKILLNCLKLAKLQGWINGVSFLIVLNEYEKIEKEIGLPIIVSDCTQKPIKSVLNSNSKNFKLSNRQSKIIEFLKKNQKAQVMDLMAVLPDVTKRTIRRDLDELLKMGKVAREGEFNQVLYKISGSPSSAS